MGYRLDGRGSILGRGKVFISTSQNPDRLWDPFSFLSDGYQGFSPGVKRPEHEADHPYTSSAEVKMVELYSPILLNGVVLICLINKAMGQLNNHE
jgi:hypothetical protein